MADGGSSWSGQTVAFLDQKAGTAPRVLIGDLNVYEDLNPCADYPTTHPWGLQTLRDNGYIDGWPAIHGTAEGYTGMVNR
jgi:predicted extracellular nuclease